MAGRLRDAPAAARPPATRRARDVRSVRAPRMYKTIRRAECARQKTDE
jgi:hypothetical protein